LALSAAKPDIRSRDGCKRLSFAAAECWASFVSANLQDAGYPYFNHPRFLKYQNGVIALASISTMANG
jgi:hypothetical protein